MPNLEMRVLQAELAESLEKSIAHVEAGYRLQLEELAQHIISSRSRVVLLAGPSSSGKTTTANLLADTLRADGHAATVISLDDFYRSRYDADYPRTPDGKPDYEAPESLRLDLVRGTIARVVRGEPAPVPRYDFKLGRRFDNAMVVDIPQGGCAIIEGLHALNPVLTEGMARTAITRVFVSVSTNLVDGDGKHILSGRKIRFIRRLTRDFLYRASDARRTLDFWGGVKRGEDKYLYPYKETADFKFDTFHRYELGVMKPWTEQVLADSPELTDPLLDTVRGALAYFDEVPIDMVPETSLIREFVPGGIYEHLY